MKKIAIVTSTRADYGILTPLIRAVSEEKELELRLMVTGTHLSEAFGKTVSMIEEDGFAIACRVPIMVEGNLPCDVSAVMANALCGFAQCFAIERPDLLVLLGDRTEMLGVAAAAVNERIPIAHIHGGEVTEGAVDDCIRHALSKMSYLHFTSTEIYRRRVIQLGESPERVFNVGALGAENILHTKLMSEPEIRELLSIPEHMPYAAVTFHPVTLEAFTAEQQVRELCLAMESRADIFYLITMANADVGGDSINRLFRSFAQDHAEHVKMVSNLGMQRYLSAVKYASFVLGNSSSGIIEAPVLGTPTVNIGDRQRGRWMPGTVICGEPECGNIKAAMQRAADMEYKPVLLYGDGSTSQKIVEIMKRFLLRGEIELKKGFYDVMEEADGQKRVLESGIHEILEGGDDGSQQRGSRKPHQENDGGRL